MWNGTVTFGEFWAGYIGTGDQNTPHRHIAIQIAIGLDGDMRIDWEGGRTEAAGVMIGPRIEHAAVADCSDVAFLYVYPNAPLGRALQTSLREPPVMRLDDDITGRFRATRDFAALIAALGARLHGENALDPRLASALATLRDDAGQPGAIARAAKAAAISEPRLRYLADVQIGVPLSQWVLWQKLERAMRAVAAGANLSDAAAFGGFADQSHFSRVMRRMFGVSVRSAVHSLRSSSDSFKNSPDRNSML